MREQHVRKQYLRPLQAALSHGMSEVAHSELRGPSLFARNKEGLLSVPGYWALHLLSAGLGGWIRSSAAAAAGRAADGVPRVSLRPLFGWLASVAGVGLALEGLTTALAAVVEPVSRRSCNAAYVAWMLSFNTQARNLRKRLLVSLIFFHGSCAYMFASR